MNDGDANQRMGDERWAEWQRTDDRKKTKFVSMIHFVTLCHVICILFSSKSLIYLMHLKIIQRLPSLNVPQNLIYLILLPGAHDINKKYNVKLVKRSSFYCPSSVAQNTLTCSSSRGRRTIRLISGLDEGGGCLYTL